MSINRRSFSKWMLTTGLLSPLLSCQDKSAGSEKLMNKNLRILLLGGTSFLGPHQIAAALKAGHQVSIFTRGKSVPTVHQDLLDQVEKLVGDRENDLTALEGREWDVVIDNSGRKEAWTDRSAQLLKDQVNLYVYTSSTGVFFPYVNSHFLESSPVNNVLPDTMAEDDEPSYKFGVMKTLSEERVRHHFGEDRSLIIRPTYMLGPGDRTERSIYWPLKLHNGGEVMIPGKPHDAVQYIDIRDVADWMMHLIEKNITGTFNAVGPENKMGMQQFVENAAQSFSSDKTYIQVDDYDFLKERNVQFIVPWIMPTDNHKGTAAIQNSKALANGLSFRPLASTVKDIYTWWHSDTVPEARRNEYYNNENSVFNREKSILAEWKSHNG